MNDILLNWLLDNYPGIFICIVIAVAVYYATRFYYTRFKVVENKVDALPCDMHREEIAAIKAETGKLDTMCEQLTEITRWIMKTDPFEIDRLAPKYSPRRLSKAGLELYTVSGSDKVVDAEEDKLLEELHSMNPQTPLDVEDDSYSVLMGHLSDAAFNGVKNYIYYQPERITLKGDDGKDLTIRLSLPLLVKLMSIVLRDRYLKKYPMLD